MAGRRIALLVATSRYADDEFRKLRAPSREAEELRQVLVSQGDFQAEVLHDESKRGIESAIEDVFAGAAPDDFVLLYVSGHGIKNDRGQLFFAACNTDMARVESTAVSSIFVQHQLSGSQAGTKVVLLDCCFSGAFSHGLVPKAAEQIDLGQLAGRGSCTITATSALEYAYEDRSLTSSDPVSSLFTRALLDGIRTGAADLDGDGLITGDELYKHVRAELDGTGQTPKREMQMSGDFVLARTTQPGASLPAALLSESAPMDLGTLLAHPKAEVSGPAGTTLNVVAGTRATKSGWEPFLLDLSEAHSHLAVLGPSQSGKTHFLRTLLLSLAADSAPDEVRIHLIDSESRFGLLSKLPHVAEVLGPEQSGRIEEALTEADAAISARRALFREQAFESPVEFRAARRNRALRGGGFQDIFLVIDRWEVFAAENPRLVERVERIADHGASFGVHVVIAARSWSKIQESVLHHFRTKVELPSGGGSATAGGRRFQLVTPGSTPRGVGTVQQALVTMVEDIAGRKLYDTTLAPELSSVLGIAAADFDPNTAWSRSAGERLRIPVGVDPFGRTVHVDLRSPGDGGAGPHGMIIGEAESGAVETMRSMALQLMSNCSPRDVNLAFLTGSPRLPFRDFAAGPHVALYSAETLFLTSRSSPQFDALRREIVRRRRKNDGARPALVVFIHNMAASPADGVGEQLLEIMELGGEVGVHVVLLARSLAGSLQAELADACGFWIVHRARRADSELLLGNAAAAELSASQPGIALLKSPGSPAIRFRAWNPDRADWSEQVDRLAAIVPDRAVDIRNPMSSPITLGELLAAGSADPELGTDVPIGIVDHVEEGEARPLRIPVGANLAISGDGISGKAFLARTAVLAFALAQPPEELHLYFVGSYHSCTEVLAELPHVAADVDIADVDATEMVLNHLCGVLEDRRKSPSDVHNSIVLVLEQLEVLTVAAPHLLPKFEKLAQEGPGHKIGLITVSREKLLEDLNLHEQFPMQVWLSSESPGVGTAAGRPFRAALPWLDSDDLVSQKENTRALARRIAGESGRSKVRGLSLPPEVVPYRELLATAGAQIRFGKLAGLDRWAELNLSSHPHLLCLGEPGAGKTNLVRLVLTEIERLYAISERNVFVLDPKRRLFDRFQGRQRSYAASVADFNRILNEAAFQVETRSFQGYGAAEGPRPIFLVIADCELFNGDMLQRYADVLARGGEAGVHLIVTRNSINVGGTLNSGFLGKLRASGCATVVLSGDERDGELLPGVSSRPQPPGRGRLVRGSTIDLVQVAQLTPPDESSVDFGR
ncbi:FtsK/SpoIIIE domain-containing protein [Saccharopolyspora sp. NPDC002686]|uniref:caspase, EACC1-associated type n=1 Tax=Saccharopolyspora sp. NPDC002686 TaxID=3154541 RepID=UPI0033284C8F